MTASTGHSIWIHPTDVAAEGADAVVAAVKEMGLGAISLAATYHAGRFLLPHDPKSSVKLLEDGVAWYLPDAARWKGQKLQPRSEERRVGKECCLVCRSRWSPYH